MGNEMTGQAPIIFPQEKGSTSAVIFFFFFWRDRCGIGRQCQGRVHQTQDSRMGASRAEEGEGGNAERRIGEERRGEEAIVYAADGEEVERCWEK